MEINASMLRLSQEEPVAFSNVQGGVEYTHRDGKKTKKKQGNHRTEIRNASTEIKV